MIDNDENDKTFFDKILGELKRQISKKRDL